ncbi:MAG: SPOR domain-containing protein [Spirochaetes bacterium]|nr:SPOR domain-containing protein [Spirochaetota bacterium]
MMEEFNVPHQQVREKSVYLLHLDAARIILISAAVIGIVVVSFLLGMNFVKKGDSSPTMLTNNDIFDSQKELDLLKTNIPGGLEDDDLVRPVEEKLVAPDKDNKGIAGDALLPGIDDASKSRSVDKSVIAGNETADVLTNENIKDPVAALPAPKAKPKRSRLETKNVSRSSGVDSVDRPSKKSSVKNNPVKKKRSRSSVVAVSDDLVERKDRSRGGYAIQVGSFDQRGSAQSAVRSLKDMNYDAHVDPTSVKGKLYFRVRIGPIASKRKALDLLKDIQNIDRYQESYMTRE